MGVLALSASLGVMPVQANCLAAWEIQETLAQGKAIEPRKAISIAREQVSGADVMRGGLCRNGDTLIYQVLMLRKDGRVVSVTIDASSGKVVGVY